ncbi:MAG: hypothetical protein J6J86_04520 [Lachnospiraceae bacterium]|nr:hypothetical protein [Lachnospiraceae bacterium]MBP3543469.1 hypothetical protein [Lachnospiraceae bacterium]
MSKEKMTEEQKLLEEAREKAVSFPGLAPPNDAEPIGQIEELHDTFYYYRDSRGNFYYISGRTRRFEEEMLKAQKKRRERWKRMEKTAEAGASNGQ